MYYSHYRCELPGGPAVRTGIADGTDGECRGTMSCCTFTASRRRSTPRALGAADEETFEHAGTFYKQDFTGTVARILPPINSIPSGCRSVIDATACGAS